MPPCSWTQSWIISVARGPTQALAALTVRPASGCAVATARAAAVAMPWHASRVTLSSAMRCLRAWYDASARPKEYRSPRYSTVVVKTVSMMPVVSAHCSVHATWRACSISAAASPTGPTTAPAGTTTSSKRTSAKRRTRSRPDIGVTDRPATPAGTRTWLRPPSCSTATSRWSAWAPASTGEQVPESTKPPPSGRPLTGRAPHQAAMRSPPSKPGSTSAFCSDEPVRPRAPATTLTGTSGPGATTRPISSATSTRSSTPCSENEPPPSASGTSSDVQPSCAPRTQTAGS